MKSVQTDKTETRAYLSPLSGFPVERQRIMAADARCNAIYVHGPVDTGGMHPRERWMDDLRAGDTAWLPSIRCLVLPARDRPERYRPLAEMCRALNKLLAKHVLIVDAKAGCSSADPEKWADHVYAEGQHVSAGMRSIVQRRKSIRKAAALRLPGVRARWAAPAMAAELERQRVIWTGAGTVDRVIRHLHPELRAMKLRTLYDILGPRRPDDPTAGGRGRKRKSR